MFDDAADVVEAGVRQAGITVTGECILALVPDRHMRVHARTVILADGLGHEGCRLAIGMGDLLRHVFVDLRAVGGLHQLAECHAQFVLRGGNLVMLLVHRQPHFEHGRDHLGADIHARIDRRDGEVAALCPRTVAHVAAFVFLGRVARHFDIVDLEARTGVAVEEAHVVEHEEFGFDADIDGIAQAGGLQIGFGTLCGRTRVTRIERAVAGFHDVANDDQHWRGTERIDIDRVEVGLQDHVGFVDGLPAFDR